MCSWAKSDVGQLFGTGFLLTRACVKTGIQTFGDVRHFGVIIMLVILPLS